MIIEWYSKDRCCWLKGKVTEEEFESYDICQEKFNWLVEDINV